MRNEEHGDAQLAPQIVQKVDDLRLDGNVERGDGLVGDDELGLHDDGARDADALALPARELVRVSACVLADKTDLFEDVIHLLIDVVLVLDAVDDESFRDDVAHGHTRIERSDGILEDHLDAVDDALVARDVKARLIILLDLLPLFVRRTGGKRFLTLLFDRCDDLFRMILVAELLIVLGGGDELPVFENGGAVLLLRLGAQLLVEFFGLRLVGALLDLFLLLLVESGDLFAVSGARRTDGLFIRARARADALPLEVDVARSDVIELDDGTARGRLAAARLADKAEDLALLDVETDVVDRFEFAPGAHLEILTEMFDLQQGLFLMFHDVTPFLLAPPPAPPALRTCGPSCGRYARSPTWAGRSWVRRDAAATSPHSGYPKCGTWAAVPRSRS